MHQNPLICSYSARRLWPALAGLLIAPGLLYAAGAPQAPPPETGTWVDDTGAGVVEIYVCADRADRLCGRIVWLKEPLNVEGVPKRDRHNPTETLQARPICGLPVLGNLAQVPEGGFDGGWIYDPKVGKSYSAAIQLASDDRLTVTGYLGVKFLSKTFAWTRAPADLQRCETAPGARPQDTNATSPAGPASKPATDTSTTLKATTAPVGASLAPPQPKPATAPGKTPATPKAAAATSAPAPTLKASASSNTGAAKTKTVSPSTGTTAKPSPGANGSAALQKPAPATTWSTEWAGDAAAPAEPGR